MVAQANVRQFGKPSGAAGVQVVESQGESPFRDTKYGTSAYYGILRRGPMGTYVPVRSREQYDYIYNDLRELRWHIFRDKTSVLPDAIDGHFKTGGASGTMLINRIELPEARRASATIYNRQGGECLKVYAANPGVWGGAKKSKKSLPVLDISPVTFSVEAGDLKGNEYAGGYAIFEDGNGNTTKAFNIVANERATHTGVGVITVGSQFDLTSSDNQLGGSPLDSKSDITGATATYTRYLAISGGTVSYIFKRDLAGSITIISGSNSVSGSNTSFTSELSEGDAVYSPSGELRVVQSVLSDTQLTVTEAFQTPVESGSLKVPNLQVLGDSTTFDSDPNVNIGDYIALSDDGSDGGWRQITAINSDTELTVSTAFAIEADGQRSGVTPAIDSRTVTFDSDVSGDVSQGDYIYVAGVTPSFAEVTAVDTQSVTIATSFEVGFSGETMSKQAVFVSLYLDRDPWSEISPYNPESSFGQSLVDTTGQETGLESGAEEGLAVEIGQGTRFPATHFSFHCYFNGSLVVSVDDASLDPSDPYYVEPLVLSQNVAFDDGETTHAAYIEVENLWRDAYVTAEGSDVRPANGFGEIYTARDNSFFTNADFDSKALVGNWLYPSPYRHRRLVYRVTQARDRADIPLTDASLSGQVITGTGSTFTDYVKEGDIVIDSSVVGKGYFEVTKVVSDTSIEGIPRLGFALNGTPADVKVVRLGRISVDRSISLERYYSNTVDPHFLVKYPIPLMDGYDGDVGSIPSYEYSKYFSIDSEKQLEYATFGKNYGLVRFAMPGYTGVQAQKAAKFYASQRAYEFRGEFPTYINSYSQAEEFINSELGRSDFITMAFPSHGYIGNYFNADTRLVPLTGDIMGGESRYANAYSSYHVPFAGNNSILPRVLRLPFKVDIQGESVLNIAGIQPIKIVNGNSVVFGGRAPSISDSYRFIHIRRIQSNYVRLFMESQALMEQLFSPNQPGLMEHLIMSLESFARREYKKGVFSRYVDFSKAARIGDASRTQERINSGDREALVSVLNGKMNLFFRYIPTGILEELTVEVSPDTVVADFGSSLDAPSR